MIKVEGLSKTFKVARRSSGFGEAVRSFFSPKFSEVHALRDVSFSIDEGEIVGYIGPNGAGKSTTIKVMSGILVPDKGECSIMGYVPWRDRVKYVKNIGVVFGQRSQLWADVPVMDSFELLRDIYKVQPANYKKSLDLLTETLNLGEILTTPTRQLSLGQRMRCEIAASLIHDPKILFLDEPTIGLDAMSKIAVRNFIKMINKEKKVTVILTTHDMNDIETLANRIIMIGKGQILYDGNLNNLREKFVTHKTVTVDYNENTSPLELDSASLLSWSKDRATYVVDIKKRGVSDIISELSAKLELTDVAVDSEPIEEIIIKLYKEHQV
ncbi:MAG TPA: ABC transporter [Clostridiales bacterium]|nr:MAG: ABC transporter [Clostridiales bacterium GWD2_32_19]HCC07229.1 ABC transporter [Clostridiales bacterium]